MTTRSLPDADAARIERGRALYDEHSEEIIASYSKGQFRVPSRTSDGVYHYVKITSKQEACSCQDHGYRGVTCAHIIAATIARAKTRQCEGCGKRFRHRELYDVVAESPPFSEGMRLCSSCAIATDTEVA